MFYLSSEISTRQSRFLGLETFESAGRYRPIYAGIRIISRAVRPVEDPGKTAACPAADRICGLQESLPGLDIRAALTRLGGNVRLLRVIMAESRGGHKDASARISDALRGGGTEDAALIAHTIKRLAGDLAATHLYAAARELEMLVCSRSSKKPEDFFLRSRHELIDVLLWLANIRPDLDMFLHRSMVGRPIDRPGFAESILKNALFCVRLKYRQTMIYQPAIFRH